MLQIDERNIEGNSRDRLRNDVFFGKRLLTQYSIRSKVHGQNRSNIETGIHLFEHMMIHDERRCKPGDVNSYDIIPYILLTMALLNI